MRYQNLFFDLDDTLFDFEQSEINAFHHLAPMLGIDITSFPLYHQVNLGCWKEMEKGLLPMERIGSERFRRFLPLVDCHEDPEKTNALFLDLLSKEGIVYPGVRGILEELHQKGHCLSIVSNGIAKVQDGRFEASGMTDVFDHIFISERIGYPKPDKRFFDAVFKALSYPDKASCAIIGDSLTSDMQGGRNAGIHTIWYNPKGEKRTRVVDEEIANLTMLLSL